MILKNPASVPIRKERLSLTSKARREAGRNKFVKKRARRPTESKALEKSIVARIVPQPGLGGRKPA